MTETQKQQIKGIVARALKERQSVLSTKKPSYAHLAGYMASALEQILELVDQDQ